MLISVVCLLFLNVYSAQWGVQSFGEDHKYIGGYLEYIGECSVHHAESMTSGGYHECIS